MRNNNGYEVDFLHGYLNQGVKDRPALYKRAFDIVSEYKVEKKSPGSYSPERFRAFAYGLWACDLIDTADMEYIDKMIADDK